TYFLWDRWDEAVAAYDRFLPVFRIGEFGRRSGVLGLATGVVAGVHLLRGEREAAERLEERVADRREAFDLLTAQALLGAGEPGLALDRVRSLRGPRLRVWAIRAEAYAMLAAWDELDQELRRIGAVPTAAELPRVMAQVDRARGIAGDESALVCAIT